MKNVFFIIIAVVFTAPLFAQSGHIEVTITGIQNTKGTIEIGVYDSKSSFPNYGNAVKVARVPPKKKGTLKHTFENLPDGTYAVAVWHDVNGNREIDKNILGAPKEAYGFSKNNFGTFGPPNFKDVSFQIVDRKDMKFTINLE
jgi:uncharacterized protein (DUF2141 family)